MNRSALREERACTRFHVWYTRTYLGGGGGPELIECALSRVLKDSDASRTVGEDVTLFFSAFLDRPRHYRSDELLDAIILVGERKKKKFHFWGEGVHLLSDRCPTQNRGIRRAVLLRGELLHKVIEER